MLRIDLYELLRDEISVLKFLQSNNLIPLTYECSKCRQIKQITSLKNERCNLRVGSNKCHGEGSIYKNTLFEKVKIELKVVIFLLYEWCEGTPTNKAAKEYSCDQSCVSKWYKKFQNFAVNAYDAFENTPIGGVNVVVQIDETCIVKRKSHQGRILRYQKWIFGGVELGNHNNFFFQIVENRSRDSLLQIIQEKIRPGSIIMSDMWRGYTNLESILNEHNYTHLTVNHSETFVNPITGANTQSIEAFWSVIKRNLRKIGTNHGNIDNLNEKLKTNLIKKKYDNNLFEIMLIIISMNYS